MTIEMQPVSERQCQEWRIAYRDGKSPYELAVESDYPRTGVYEHLVGDCGHGGDEPPISRGQTHNISISECRDIRDRYDSGESVETLQASTGRRWKTLVRHLTGNCSHDDVASTPTVAKEEILRRDPVTASECVQMRRKARDAASVMAYADTVDRVYPVVLAHVNGECTHEVDEPPRETVSRRQDVSPEDCQAIREAYRSKPSTKFNEIAEEYNCSQTTVERHVTFRCSHPPGELLVTDVEAVQDLLEPSGGDSDGLSQVTSEDIVQLDTVERGDQQDPARDLASPNPDRVETTRSRIIRNTDLTHDMKRMYNHTCQICGVSRQGLGGSPYAEAHHIRPLGRPHEGPEDPENILVLCPNHHADFDYGRLTVDPETHRVTHTYEESADGTELDILDPHEISEDHLTYHNEVIAGK